MKFSDIRVLFRETEYFDFATLLQLSGEPREHVRMQIHRWATGGKLIRLRKGLYAFAEPYQRKSLSPPALAAVIYPPSYLSLQWALGFYGLIPERVVTLTSVTTRQTNSFENALGFYVYRHVKPNLFADYHKLPIGDDAVWMASPEKALLDLWYLEPGPWTAARMREMRFQNFDQVDPNRLHEAAAKFASRRVDSAVSIWLKLATAEEEEGEEL